MLYFVIHLQIVHASPTYLITAPREFHVGVPTTLSVSILASSTVTVRAELQGDGGGILTQAEATLSGGDTDLSCLNDGPE